MAYTDILLTTYPAHKSRNVGDALIAHSAMRLIKARNPQFAPLTLFREASLENYDQGQIKNIIAPGFSISPSTYPDLYRLYNNLENMPAFFPIGCSFQNVSPTAFTTVEYDKKTLEVLNFLTAKFGPLPCRDQLIVNMLNRFNVPAVYSGDLALFDEEYLHKPFIPPSPIRSIVMTLQHHPKYQEQSLRLLHLIRQIFPQADLFVSMHSKPNPMMNFIAEEAEKIGYSTLRLSGNVDNLDQYNPMDLHIGYRLHGHIAFLRKRKASILLVEDARGFGFARTAGTSHGCFPAFLFDSFAADYSILDCVKNFLARQIEENFEGYKSLFNFLDKTYKEFIDPYFAKIAHRVGMGNC
ncbi:polysaccharide pyruvyl transferase family protein [Legionella sp. 27cVA30]|uniref:polysaccharide pyruvyl transferase family protein n=1 Tax=Legionella sp. 27cVA30 TaxID=2905657 RepID=UPI00209D8F45|nr:polysaccharide pyruvyl transferase family protein [Legionella sp. 27cVA30]MCP0913853.1 polysaccharide pyruvyl transferase family protein [Legionella sp. 27cVA30]